MKTISYVIQDPIGLHARPAGQLAKSCWRHGKNAISKSLLVTRLLMQNALWVLCSWVQNRATL